MCLKLNDGPSKRSELEPLSSSGDPAESSSPPPFSSFLVSRLCCRVFIAPRSLWSCLDVWISKKCFYFFPFVSLKPSFIFTSSLLSSDLLSSFSFSCCSFAAAQLSYLSLEQGRRRRRSDSQTWESNTNTHQSAVLCRRGIRNSRRVDAATRRLIKALAWTEERKRRRLWVRSFH